MDYRKTVLEHLSSMGFEPAEIEGIGYVFAYEDINILYMPDEDDENFLRISIPSIFDVTEENLEAVLEAAQETSLLLKYTKINIMHKSSVWAVYEHYLVSEENMDELLEHMIRALLATANVFQKKIDGEDLETPDDSDND